jgi:hypothetical protein
MNLFVLIMPWLAFGASQWLLFLSFDERFGDRTRKACRMATIIGMIAAFSAIVTYVIEYVAGK